MTDTVRPSSGSEVGRPLPCLLAGALMLAIPTLLELLAPPPTSAEDSGVGLAVTLILVIGAIAVVLTTARPRTGMMAGLAVLCTAIALVLVPPEPMWDGVCGFVCLIFLLAVRLHRQNLAVPLGEWLGRHRPMLIGAAVTTPAAIVAAEVPTEWSLFAAGAVGLISAAVCVLLFLNWD
jgi:hypothetical protein